MRKLVLKMSMSLDGFVCGPDGDIAWIFDGDQESKAAKVQAVSQAGLHIMGSRTFAAMAAHWPGSTDAFAAPMNRTPKVVFSSQGQKILPVASARQNSESWSSATVAGGDLATEIGRLKAQDGAPILAHGGASFAGSLIAAGLVDEYDLTISPVALGDGRRIFTTRTNLQRVAVRSFPNGAVAYTLRPHMG